MQPYPPKRFIWQYIQQNVCTKIYKSSILLCNPKRMKSLLFVSTLLFTLLAFGQKREEFFNFSFKPATTSPYYYVVTEKRDSLWYRVAYYVSQKTQAIEAWYRDDSCKIEHGSFNWFHPNRNQKLKGICTNGKKEGLWLEWNENGQLIDSSMYKNGKRMGVGMRWHDNGMAKDSFNFDGSGNGVQVGWYDDGQLFSAGRLMGENRKTGRWQYFDKSGKLWATEDYTEGKKTACLCYDETGVQLDTAACKEEAAVPAGGKEGWRRFLERELGRLLQDKTNSRQWTAGQVTVLVKFEVQEDGSLKGFTPVTQYGKGIEEEVIKMLLRSPRWTPGRQWGRIVKSYHTQPVSFMIQSQ
jgi:antitoxin component YwqK of YwqJK toxin-antitoxin module